MNILKNLFSQRAYWQTNKLLARLTSLDASTLLADLYDKQLYFMEKEELEEDGYFFNTRQSIEQDTTLCPHAQRAALKLLEKYGFIDMVSRGLPKRTFYKVNEYLVASFFEMFDNYQMDRDELQTQWLEFLTANNKEEYSGADTDHLLFKKSTVVRIRTTNGSDTHHINNNKENNNKTFKEKTSKKKNLQRTRKKPSNKPLCRFSNNQLTEQSKNKILSLPWMDEEYASPFFDWLEYKKGEKNQTYKTEQSLKGCFTKLINCSESNPSKAVEVVEHSIGNLYSGLFPLKQNNFQQPNRVPKPNGYVPDYNRNVKIIDNRSS